MTRDGDRLPRMTDQPVKPKTSGMAIAGFVLAFLFGALGVIFSAIALGQIERSKGQLGGRGLAIAGLVISIATFALALLAAISIPAFLTYMHKSKASEATLHLKQLERAFKATYYERAAFPDAIAPLAPARSCCESGGTCKGLMDFDSPVWSDLGFAPYPPTHFQYSYTSTAKHVEALAVGDLDCDGTTITYKLIMDARADGAFDTRIELPTNPD